MTAASITTLFHQLPALQHWQIGALFGCLTSCIAAASKLTIRKSWLMENTKQARIVRITGMLGMSVLNPVFDLLAMSYANPSLLSGFSGLALALIVLCSPLVTGEVPSPLQKTGCALIVTGQLLSMSFGDHSSDVDTSIDDILQSYQRPSVIAYLLGMTCWMTLLYFWKNSSSPIKQRCAWGLMSGSITGVQMFLKDSLTIGKRLQDDFDNQFSYELAAILLLLLLGTLISALGGLFILTAAMSRYDATYANAMHAGSFVVSCSIMSLIRYQTTPVNTFGYGMGLLIILAGVSVLVKESANSNNRKRKGTSNTTKYDHLTEVSTVCSDSSDDTSNDDDDETAPLSDEEALLEHVVEPFSRRTSYDDLEG